MEFKYRTIVNQHQRRVYSLAMHMLANGAEAEDVTQEVFERLWRHINEISVDEARPWLLRVTRNCAIDLLRKRTHLHQELTDDLICDRQDNTPEGFLAKANLNRWLKNAINRLKEPYKTLIILADLQQYSVKEVASSVDMTENQVKVYVHRGRKQLRNLLQGVEL